jgi:hypothetical protein
MMNGSISIPDAITFKDKFLNRPVRDQDHRDLETSSEATTSISPLRSDLHIVTPDKRTPDEEHSLLKIIRGQIRKQPIKIDPPAWTKHLCYNLGNSVETRKKHLETYADRKKDSLSTSKEPDMVVEDPSMVVTIQTPYAASATGASQSAEEEIVAIADKARAEIAELEAQLARQEQEALQLAEQAAAIVAQLEVEADKKAKMAEVALLKAKLALQGVHSVIKYQSDITATIAQTLSSAEKGNNVAEERAEISSTVSTRDKRQDHSIDDNYEVSAITEDVVDIVEPPKILRQIEFPTHVETRDMKDLTVVTDICDVAHEWVVSPLYDDSPRKRTTHGRSTRETIFKKIEECQEMISDPNASMEEQFKAAELLEKMARIAKIAEELEPKKTVATPPSCTEAVPEAETK